MARKHEIRETPHDTKSRIYRLAVHYLGLGYPAETVAEIVGTSVSMCVVSKSMNQGIVFDSSACHLRIGV